MTRARRVVAALVGTLLLAGCGGLPLSGGVREPGQVAGPEQRADPGVSALVAGPQPGDSAQEVVEGFLGAQVSAEDDHAVARSYFTPEAAPGWQPDLGVLLYDGAPAVAEQADGRFAVTVRAVGRQDAVGAATVVEPPAPQVLEHVVALQPDGQWRLVSAPPGLSLPRGDRDLAFRPYDVFHLAPDAPGRLSSDSRHLVADRVYVSVDDPPAQALVDRVLAGPSVALEGAAESAVEPGLSAAVTLADVPGVIAVDLAPDGRSLSPAALEQLSAQLVWTLRQVEPFSALRLLAGGAGLEVPGVGDGLQPRASWPLYDPDAQADRAPAYVVADRRLQLLPPAPGETDTLRGLTVTVDGVLEAAVSPRGGQVALLRDDGDDNRTLALIGPRGALVPSPETQAVPGLSSPTWGSGERGLFLLRRSGPRPEVVVVTAGAAPVVVAVDLRDGLVDPSVLRVSRDGVRVALVDGGVLSVGRLVAGESPQQLRITGLRVLARDVTDVAWLDSANVLALVGTGPRLPQPFSVDGTAGEPLSRLGLQGDPVSLAAGGDQPLLVETVVEEQQRTYRDDGTDFTLVPGPSGRPLYPG